MSSAHLPSSAARYHPVAVVLHWVLGLGLLGLFAFGLYMESLPFSPQRLKYYNWHKWAGIVILAGSALRLAWRLWSRPPALPDAVERAMPVWQRHAHRATHGALYAMFFIVPLLGWAYSSAAGFPIVLFGVWPLPDFVPVNPELAEALKPWHGWAAKFMIALVVLHVAGALKHAVVDRDGLLRRMTLGRS